MTQKPFGCAGLQTVRPAAHDSFSAQIFTDETRVQDLHYTYDPVGNFTEIADRALRTVFHRNHRVDPACRYAYDPLYRLIEATGRENIGQSAFDFAPPDGDYRDYPFVGAARLDDLQALQQFRRALRIRSGRQFPQPCPPRRARRLDAALRLSRRELPRTRKAQQSPEPDGVAARREARGGALPL